LALIKKEASIRENLPKGFPLKRREVLALVERQCLVFLFYVFDSSLMKYTHALIREEED